MKSSNLAWRYEMDGLEEVQRKAESAGDNTPPPSPPRAYRSFSMDDRAIVIRDQGLRPFRVR